MRTLVPVVAFVALVSPAVAAQPRKGDARVMKLGQWEGEYIDIEGHRARLRFNITSTGAAITGNFEMIVSTEDQPLRYQGKISGTANGPSITLKLQLSSGTVLMCDLKLREPVVHAEMAVLGTVEPARAINFGGGMLVAWKFGTP